MAKRVLSTASFVGMLGLAVSWSPTASASILGDPLHGFCNGTGAGVCVDNGTNTPLGSNSTNFGFGISPGPQTGDLTIVLLVPNNDAAPASFALTGIQGGTANNLAISATETKVSATAWTSGTLAGFLGGSFVGASPNNPIGAFLPSTQGLDPAATGYFVYTADLGQTKIWDVPNQTNGPILNMISGFSGDLGGYIVGFCGTGCSSPPVATANSGALFGNGTSPPPGPPPGTVPEPTTLALFGVGLIGLGLMRRRRTR